MSDQTGGKQESKRVLCGVLAIVLSPFALHRFMLGDVTGGIIRVILCGSLFGVISLVEEIIYLTKTDEEFIQTYQIGKKTWF